MRYHPIDPQLFVQYRKRFVSELKPNSIAIFHSNDLMPRSGDQYFPFRQQSHFFKLCGIDQENSVLILYPNAPKPMYREILFIIPTSEKMAIWEGQKLSPQEARQISGIEKVIWTDQFDQVLQPLLIHASQIYLNVSETDRFQTPLQSKDLRFAKELKQKFPVHQYERSQPILRSLGMIKLAQEIELIQEACAITESAFRRILPFVKSGIKEYEVEAEIISEFIRKGSSGHAYAPILASGASACVLHYTSNNQICKDGEVMLCDFGAEYANYASDMTRSIPINGKFNARQRAVYDAVLSCYKGAMQMMVPGQTLTEIQKEVESMIGYFLVQLGLINNAKDPQAIKPFFMHGIAHHLGSDVHDLADRQAPLQSGMVLTCEPGIYITNEHLGIRLENTILVTDQGPVDLMSTIPIEAEEIEEIMNTNLVDSFQ